MKDKHDKNEERTEDYWLTHPEGVAGTHPEGTAGAHPGERFRTFLNGEWDDGDPGDDQ